MSFNRDRFARISLRTKWLLRMASTVSPPRSSNKRCLSVYLLCSTPPPNTHTHTHAHNQQKTKTSRWVISFVAGRSSTRKLATKHDVQAVTFTLSKWHEALTNHHAHHKALERAASIRA